MLSRRGHGQDGDRISFEALTAGNTLRDLYCRFGNRRQGPARSTRTSEDTDRSRPS